MGEHDSIDFEVREAQAKIIAERKAAREAEEKGGGDRSTIGRPSKFGEEDYEKLRVMVRNKPSIFINEICAQTGADPNTLRILLVFWE